jgi:hypothetical protein
VKKKKAAAVKRSGLALFRGLGENSRSHGLLFAARNSRREKQKGVSFLDRSS